MPKAFLYFLLLILISKNCYSQHLYFTSFTTSEGLTQNSIYSITQTNDGFMWFGSQHGLNRFDGKKIHQIIFNKRSSDTSSYSQMLTAMHADQLDNFWIGTTAELLIYDRYKNYIYKPQEKYPGLVIPYKKWIENIFNDEFGNLWIDTRSELFIYDLTTKKMKVISNEDIKRNTISISINKRDKLVYLATNDEIYVHDGKDFVSKNVNTFLINKNIKIKNVLTIDDQLWIIANDNSVWILNSNHNNSYEWKKFEEVFQGERPLIDPTKLHRGNDRTVWLGSRSEGVLIADIISKKVNRSSSIVHRNSLKNNFVLSLFTSNQNITWIGISGGGVAKYDQNVTQFELYRNEALPGEKQPENMFLSMYSDNDEDFYLGTLTGGMLHTNIRTNQRKYYLPSFENNIKTEANNIYTIIKGDGDLLWMATWGGLCSFNTKSKEMKVYNDTDGKTKELATLIKLKNNKLLVGGYNMGLRFFNLNNYQWERCNHNLNETEFLDIRPRYINHVSEEEVLISSESSCVIKYNYNKGVITSFPQFEKVSKMSPHFYITNKYWWIGTNDGLIQANSSTQKVIKVWNKDAGLPDNVVYSVLPDESGNIWVASNAGLTAINISTGVNKKYNENDGLQSMEFNGAVCYKDKSNNLWFGGVNGFNKVAANHVDKTQYVPKPIITGIQVMNETYKSDSVISYIQKIDLNHKSNFINFEFQSPNFSQPENMVYKYRLIGLDTTWIYSGTRNFVNYTQLKPGQYIFEVIAANTNLHWSDDAAKVSIYIKPPWYNTWWFYTISSALLLLFIRYMYLQRIVKVRTETAIKHKMYETEMAALKAQMNPHFIFNCINSIDAFIQSNDKYNASLYLNKFAKLIRNILESSKNNLVSFEKDIETIKIYIELEEMRNDNKFKTEYYIDESMFDYDIKIPPLIIQPFVENAIIHGLRNKEDNDGILSIKVTKENDLIKYEIKDNGIGRKAAANISRKKELSYGMQLSADRVRLYNEDDSEHVKIIDLYNGDKAAGTLIEVKLKIS